MVSRLKTVVLATSAAAAALVPLFGDPRVTPVTHPIWARMLLRGLEMNEAVRASTEASQVFSALSWRDSLTFPADRYTRGDGVTVQERAGVRTVAVREGTGQVDYPLTVVRAGDYQMRVRLAGKPDRPATAEIVATGSAAAVRTFKFASPASVAWVRGGPAHLDPGTYTASLLLPEGSTLEYVEVAPPCLNPIEPIGGWKPAAPTTVDDVAVTVRSPGSDSTSSMVNKTVMGVSSLVTRFVIVEMVGGSFTGFTSNSNPAFVVPPLLSVTVIVMKADPN